ncbi:hypothetical protein DFH05DRAFT_1570344 [Lentinula detonsa]|uniref:Dolichyl-phosphate-mannose--protein mannosyltransferase n=1 Tax=Lentinula detonsa TaxID=2804962 RepID=A0A9W8PCR8_9AGAR|nr:hypothetical protein DFH05DRAFT_1570344 [Lentinula detonsa]
MTQQDAQHSQWEVEDDADLGEGSTKRRNTQSRGLHRANGRGCRNDGTTIQSTKREILPDLNLQYENASMNALGVELSRRVKELEKVTDNVETTNEYETPTFSEEDLATFYEDVLAHHSAANSEIHQSSHTGIAAGTSLESIPIATKTLSEEQYRADLSVLEEVDERLGLGLNLESELGMGTTGTGTTTTGLLYHRVVNKLGRILEDLERKAESINRATTFNSASTTTLKSSITPTTDKSANESINLSKLPIPLLSKSEWEALIRAGVYARDVNVVERAVEMMKLKTATDHPISSPGYYNNDWRIVNATHIDPPVISGSPNGLRYITPGMRIKLSHISTEKMLHSHDIRPPVSEVDFQNEVSAYGAPGFQDDANDDWILEIDEAASREAVKTLRTKFRLRHALTGCYLFSHKVKLPEWGFEQQEGKFTVVRGDSDVSGSSRRCTPKVNYRLPGFLAKFLKLQQVMWTTNAGLTDRHLFDSRPDAWPRLRRGINKTDLTHFLNFWVKDHCQIYLIGNPMVWWLSTLSAVAYITVHATVVKYDNLCGFLFMVWALHYGPFWIMGRQLFLHHYFPALYFAILLSCGVFDFVGIRTAPVVIQSRTAPFVCRCHHQSVFSRISGTLSHLLPCTLTMTTPFSPILGTVQNSSIYVNPTITRFGDARRSFPYLIRAWRRSIDNPISVADRPGWIYIFYEGGGVYKVGRTEDLARRMREWDRDCPGTSKVWIGAFWTPLAHLTEKLVHLEFEAQCAFRPRYTCSCGRVHLEKFIFWGSPEIVFYRKIAPIAMSVIQLVNLSKGREEEEEASVARG